MSPAFILSLFLGYFIVLYVITRIVARSPDNFTFFLGRKVSPWYVVAYGMIGASISGVTFISIPGDVGVSKFSYMVIVMGYLVGYFVIINVLLPLYYRLNLTSIYTYLERRFGFWSYKTGSFFFILSRLIGASFRMYLVVNVLHIFVFKAWGVPFTVTTLIAITLILLYTIRGGVKAIVWTDTLQTTFMLVSLLISVLIIGNQLDLGFGQLVSKVFKSDFSKMIFTELNDKRFFLKQFFSGAFIAIVMTGLDQEMMQKNLSCRNLKDAQKNMYWLSAALVPVNFLFLTLGAILFIYANNKGIAVPTASDDLFPMLAMNYLGPLAGIVFLIGIISAAYPSADGALTALTTCFSVDFLRFNQRDDLTEKQKVRIRYIVNFGFGLLVFLVIVIFRMINDASVISKLFTVAGYTYGPLLGLFTFGLFTRFKVNDRWVPGVATIAPVICYILSANSVRWFNGYHFGFELLILNGILTFAGLIIVSKGRISHAL
ncbi:MAG: sodium:solute symporter [Bacteroidetes bacterium]|nr:sodium:solute symporter [Bacteroidota bacterium]